MDSPSLCQGYDWPDDGISLSLYPNDWRLRKDCCPGYGQVYKITPLPGVSNSTGYVGVTIQSLVNRLHAHLSPASTCVALRNAIQKHGVANFHIALCQDNVAVLDLHAAEVHWIAQHDTHRRGYNCNSGGRCPMHDPETRDQCLEARKKTYATQEYKDGVSESHKKAWQNPESKAKLSATLKKSWAKPGVRKKRGDTMKTVWADKDQHARTVAAMKEAHKRPDVKAAKSKTTSAQWNDPVYRANQIAKRNQPKSAAAFAKHSAASKAAWTPERRAAHGAKCAATRARKQAGREAAY